MTNWRVHLARLIGALVFLIGGGALQFALWRSPGEPWGYALIRHPYLWIVYFLIAHIIAEHTLRLMKPRRRP